MSRHQVKKMVEIYADILKRNRFQFTQIWLFGSYATGNANEWSDIDVAVVVAKLPRGKGYLEKKMRLWALTAQADSRIEPILLEEKDLKEEEMSIMGSEVAKHGILMVG